MFKNKVIVIAGATGTVGSGAVRAFLNEGAHVVGISRSAEKLENLRKTISIKPDEPFYSIAGDFNSDAESAKTVEAVKTILKGKPIDHVISIIGFVTLATAPTQTDSSLVRSAFDNGFFNTVLMAKYFLPDLKNQEGSSYTMVSGGLAHGLPGFIPNAENLWLATAKNAAVNSFTYGLNAETINDKVRVNTICIHFGVAPVGGSSNQMGMPVDKDTLSLAPAFLEVAKGTVKGEVICLNTWDDVNNSR
jgi:NAD(P)-dependent dehydrogenase (short-subunit alcohol dehydrogenase family)